MKYCPFCNAEMTNSDGLVLHEPTCYIMVHFYSSPCRGKDEKAWNTRPIEDALQRKLDIAVKALEYYSIEVPETFSGDDSDTARQALAEIRKDNAQNMSTILHEKEGGK